jgi:hypothetical protein
VVEMLSRKDDNLSTKKEDMSLKEKDISKLSIKEHINGKRYLCVTNKGMCKIGM